jgi:hypothetical protein
MNESGTEKNPVWSSTQYANLIRYVPSGKYYAQIRVSGKLSIRQAHRQVAENKSN